MDGLGMSEPNWDKKKFQKLLHLHRKGPACETVYY